MTPDRWRQISEIYHAALARDERERPVFLSDACANDESLRREVDSLLRHEDDAERFLEAPAFETAVNGLPRQPGGLLVGRQVGACRILSFVGAGGMGEVYRAHDTRLGRDVAIKVLPDAFTSDSDRLARFKREARLLAALNHPHVATIHSLEEFDGVPALVLEFVEGPTLADRLADDRLPLDEALDIARQLVGALAAAHEKGIVHRDLKPANIKIAPGNIVKVLDFGLAKAFAREGARPDVARAPTITATVAGEGLVVGTPAYMSPEQARGKAVDPRTDIWAFGCVLYEMLTGRPAFGGETISDTIAAILEREPDWKALPDTTPAGARRLLQRCLEKDARRRLSEIADALIEMDDRRAAGLTTGPQESERAIRSLAVLPFANASGDPQLEYLSDGLTESIILSLSQLPQLRVMARSTVFRFKGRGDDAQAIGRTLGVGAVASGRVLQRGETLVISAELVDVENGWQLWGAQYKNTVADILATEEDIASEISGKLRLNLTPQNEKRLAKRYTENVAAYHLYLKGKFCWGKRTKEALNQGLQYFRQAIDLDPTYALAYAGLAASYAPMIYYGYVSPRAGALKGRAAAQKALEIDPALSDARALLAGLKWSDEWDYSAAEEDLRAIVAADPNYFWARQLLAEILTVKGRFKQAGRETTRALELDPLSLALNAWAALERYYAREYDKAIEMCRRTIEMEANFYLGHSILGMAYEQKGQFAEAVAEMRQASALSNDSPMIVATLGAIYAAWGREEDARKIIRTLEDLAVGQYVSPVLGAVILARLGDKDRALSGLERACDDRDAQLLFLKVDPKVDTLRAEPRFQTIMRRMGLS